MFLWIYTLPEKHEATYDFTHMGTHEIHTVITVGIRSYVIQVSVLEIEHLSH